MVGLARLETFLNAAEQLSFSEAARRMHLSQPTVSHHIKMLEQELGVKLFERMGSGLMLTEGGRLLMPLAQKVVRDSIELEEMMDALKEGIAGSLRIACSTTAGKYILPQMAARFSQRYQGVQVTVLRCAPVKVISNMLDAEANLGVVSYEVYDEDIELQEFFEDSISMIVPKYHPFASRRQVDPEDIVGEPIIMREAISGTRRVVLSELAKHDISFEDLNVFMQLENAEAIVQTVAAGYGISFVSKLAAACQLEQGSVVEVDVNGINLRRKIYMLRKRVKEPHRPLEAFWSFVHDPSNKDLLQLSKRNLAVE